jgi:hypothetical protein
MDEMEPRILSTYQVGPHPSKLVNSQKKQSSHLICVMTIGKSWQVPNFFSVCLLEKLERSQSQPPGFTTIFFSIKPP